MTRYEFNVEMTCEGCSTAVTKLLTKQKGTKTEEKGEVKDFSVDLQTKMVSVITPKELQDVIAILEKSGKKVTYVKTEEN